jgi:hypothetical protein
VAIARKTSTSLHWIDTRGSNRFRSASRTARNFLSTATSARKPRYFKDTYRMGWAPHPPLEAHLPSPFGYFLCGLGTAPI